MVVYSGDTVQRTCNAWGLGMKNEAELKQYARKLAAMMGWYVLEGMGVNGAADLVLLKDGKGILAEAKFGTGKQSDDQIREQKKCDSLGVPYYVFYDLDTFRQILLEQEV